MLLGGGGGWIPPDGLHEIDDAFVRAANEVAGDAERCQAF